MLKFTNIHEEYFQKLIAEKLENWEMERTSMLDKLLMEMAVCEMIHFPTIPTKVSINEYIEISKQYSTPKSKDFINGVLDRTMKQLKEEGKIHKTGRGLVGE